VVNNGSGAMAIRKGPWKYIEGKPAQKLSEGAKKHLADQLKPQLYNLETDILETKNVILEYPKIYGDLQSTLDNIRDLGSERLDDK